MSSVVIRPDDGQADSLKALINAITKVAGDEPVTIGNGGVVVSRAVAKKYLNTKGATDPVTADTTGRTVDNTRAPVVTRSVENPVPDPAPDPEQPIGGLTPEGEFPGGTPGIPAPADPPAPDTAAGQAADSGSSSDATGGAADGETTPTPTPAKKTTPAKTTAAAKQRASRTTTARSNP